MSERQLEGFIVMQDVQTGSLSAFAATHPLQLDVTTPILPLSVSKLLLAASWWDHGQPDEGWGRLLPDPQNASEKTRASVVEMLVDGSDFRGRQLAVALRQKVGTAAVLKDFEKYGFGPQANSPQDNAFWAELAPAWRARLIPARTYTTLSQETKDVEWADTLSLGEINIFTTGLQLSSFLQAIGNGGLRLQPTARKELREPSKQTLRELRRRSGKAIRVIQERTTLRLQSAMCHTVQRGTARSIATALVGTGWKMGGKTGTGPALAPPIGPEFDGWFAGLIFDPHGKARFTVATFLRGGGKGGGKAAQISADLARFLIGETRPP